MGYIDITILVIILLIGLKGFFDGFIKEFSTLIGIIVGIFFASRLASEMAIFFNHYIYQINSPSMALILGFIIVLAFFWIGFLIIGYILSKFLHFAGLGILDRILGYVFSCIKVFCIFAFIIYGLHQINFIKEIDFVKKLPMQSKVYEAMLETAKIIVNFDSLETMEQKMQEVGKKAQKSIRQIQEKIPSPN